MAKPMIHPNADVQSMDVGDETTIWQFAVVLPGAKIGSNVNICAHCLVENDVRIGDRVTVKSGVQLWDGLTIEDDVFIGPNATFANDPFPRSKKTPVKFLRTVVRKGASIGANATILPGLTLGENCMIGAGTVVTRDVPPNAIVVGNPGRISGYTVTGTEPDESLAFQHDRSSSNRIQTNVGTCDIYQLPHFKDMRGDLSFTEFEKDLPFIAKRCFWVYGVPSKEVRGEHAHKKCHQFLICVSGQVSVLLDDGKNRAEIKLDNPSMGLHIKPGVWGVQYKYSENAVMIVLASHVYDASDYIRDYAQFIEYAQQNDTFS